MFNKKMLGITIDTRNCERFELVGTPIRLRFRKKSD